MRFTGRNGRAMGAVVLAASLGACDFITATGNPNVVSEPTLDQLTTAVQVNSFFMAEDQISRIAAMWIQQAAGTDRQFSTLDVYTHTETSGDGEFGAAYVGGGLVDLRRGQELATEQNRIAHRGMLKVIEAYMIGRTASVWGDIPYSEAVDPAVNEPRLDPQQEVYAAIQTVLDGAIADLQSGTGVIVSDLAFGGNAQRWIAAANTLKARYYIHWAEAQRAGGASATAAQTACAGDCIAKAIQAANAGISSAANDWKTVHGSASTEENVWSQFMTQRSGYIAAGAFMVDSVLETRGDPRLSVYATTATGGGYRGSRPGESLSGASQLNVSGTQRMPMATCAETQFIKAEAHYYQNDQPAARTAAAAGSACAAALADSWTPGDVVADSIPLRGNTAMAPVRANAAGWATLSGDDLFEEIMLQKYLGNFLSLEIWNDYKRTCQPEISTYQGQVIPRRLFYALGERVANTNIPDTNTQAQRMFNTNDPAACTPPNAPT